MTVQSFADDILWLSAPVWVWLSIVYLLLERSRGWIRVGLALTVVGITQMVLRALVTQVLGEDYAWRDWVLMTGRIEILLAGVILGVGLHRARWGTTRQRKAARAAALAHWEARQPSGGTHPH